MSKNEKSGPGSATGAPDAKPADKTAASTSANQSTKPPQASPATTAAHPAGATAPETARSNNKPQPQSKPTPPSPPHPAAANANPAPPAATKPPPAPPPPQRLSDLPKLELPANLRGRDDDTPKPGAQSGGPPPLPAAIKPSGKPIPGLPLATGSAASAPQSTPATKPPPPAEKNPPPPTAVAQPGAKPRDNANAAPPAPALPKEASPKTDFRDDQIGRQDAICEPGKAPAIARPTGQSHQARSRPAARQNAKPRGDAESQPASLPATGSPRRPRIARPAAPPINGQHSRRNGKRSIRRQHRPRVFCHTPNAFDANRTPRLATPQPDEPGQRSPRSCPRAPGTEDRYCSDAGTGQA